MSSRPARLVALVAFLVLGTPTMVSEVLADCASTWLYSDGSTDANARAPIARYRYERAVYLITEEELCGGPCPTTELSGIGWTYVDAPLVAGTAPLKVYLQNTGDTTNTKSTTWATAITGMTPVHDASTTLPSDTGSFDIAFSGGPFTYTGGGLYVAFDWGPYAGGLSVGTVSTHTQSTSGIKSQQSNTAAPTTLVASNNRPETRFSSPVPGTDVYVSYVISMGAVPLGLVGAQDIRATVYQLGDLDLTDIPVTLDVTGAETSTDTQTAPSVARCGGFASVAFAPFTPTLTGVDTITASTPPNPVPNGGESLSASLDVNWNRYSYKHAEDVAGSGLVNGSSNDEFVARFNVTSATQVDAMTVAFLEATGTHYRLVIRGDDGTGKPGALLYVDAADRIVDAAGDTTIRLPSPIAVGAGNFFAGIRQTNTTFVTIGCGFENPGRVGTFFAYLASQGTWFDFAETNVANFRLDFGVTLGSCAAPLTVDVTPGGMSNAACSAPIAFTATPTGTAPFTYQWTENGSDIPGATGSTYSASHAVGSFTYNCKVTDSGGCTEVEDAAAATGTWGPTATVSGDGNICAGASIALEAALAGTGPWNLTWSDGFVQNGVAVSPATRTVSPVATTTYSVTILADVSCTGTSSGSALVTVNPVPAETASGSGTGNILEWSGKDGLLWPANLDASSYTIDRGQQADLPHLLTSAVDSCTRYEGAATSVSGISEVPATGDFYWYLVTGTSAAGCVGGAGAGRLVNDSGLCP